MFVCQIANNSRGLVIIGVQSKIKFAANQPLDLLLRKMRREDCGGKPGTAPACDQVKAISSSETKHHRKNRGYGLNRSGVKSEDPRNNHEFNGEKSDYPPGPSPPGTSYGGPRYSECEEYH